jgi:UDP-glucose 4-epimerase
MARILVTGGAGFIGSHIVDRCIEHGHEVAVVDNLVHGRKENLNSAATFYEIDILDHDVEMVFKEFRPDFVYHFAAQIDVRDSVADPIFDVEVNIIGSLKLIELSRKFKVQRFIFASTGGAIYPEGEMPADENTVEQPISPYGINKLAVDHYLHYYHEIFGFNYTSLRFANVYGPRQDAHGESGVTAIFVSKFLRGESPVKFGEGLQTRDFVYVQDVVDAALACLKAEKSAYYNIGSGVETTLNDFITTIQQAGGFEDIGVIQAPAKKGEVMRSILLSNYVQKDLAWQPKTSLEHGLIETIAWFKSQM